MTINELLLDRVRSVIFTDLADGSVIGRLTKIEDPSLQTTSDSEEVTDAIGALISKLFRAKRGRFEASNSIFSMDLLAQQYGSEKEIASIDQKFSVPCEEILEVSEGTIVLSHTPNNTIKYIYKLEKGGLAKTYELGASVSDSEFTVSESTITVPTGVTGKIYVEYEYDSENAVRVSNSADKFPKSVGVKIFAIFRDQCNDNIEYAGVIKAKKGKIDPSSIDMALTATGKHSFAIDFLKEYCDDTDDDLFSVIIAQ